MFRLIFSHFQAYVYITNIYILNGDTLETLHDTFNWAIILQYCTILIINYFVNVMGSYLVRILYT